MEVFPYRFDPFAVSPRGASQRTLPYMTTTRTSRRRRYSKKIAQSRVFAAPVILWDPSISSLEMLLRNFWRYRHDLIVD
jgi:hypothetical protein